MEEDKMIKDREPKGKKENKRYNCVGNTIEEESNLFTSKFVKELSEYKFENEILHRPYD